MKNIVKISSLVGLGIVFSVTVAFAAVQLSVSQQRVKTLRAVLTYQDVIAAPQIDNDSTTRLLKIVDVPAEVEIISAYMKTSNIFELNGDSVLGSLDAHEDNQPIAFWGAISSGDLRTPGVISGRESFNQTLLFPTDADLYLSVHASQDLSGLTGGNLEIIVNYIDH